jgi:hypothetical protein
MVPLTHFFAYVYLCAAGSVCNKENALWDNQYLKGFPTEEACMNFGMTQLALRTPPINKSENFTFEGERLKIHVECKKGVDI